MKKKFKISDILDSTPIQGNSDIIKFVNQCKNYISKSKTELKNFSLLINLNSLKRKVFCYQMSTLKNEITFPRETIISVLNKSGSSKLKEKSVFEDDKIKEFLMYIGGIDKKESSEYKIFELNDSYDYAQGNVKLKQELVCVAISFFFRYPSKNVYHFHEYIKNDKTFTSKNFKSELSSEDFNKFASTNNFKYIIDSVGTAKSLIHNKGKLNLNNLRNYLIVEESGPYGKMLKDDPYNKIKQNPEKIQGYYANSDKLMIADIFLLDTSNTEFNKTISILKNPKQNLSHEQYRTLMNSSFRKGVIIPISLKQLRPQDVDNNFITQRFKVVGSYNEKKENKSIEDDYMMKVNELFNVKNKQVFFKKLKDVIDIKYRTTNFMLSSSPPQANISFESSFKIGEKNKREYNIWVSNSQIYVKPKSTSSYSGLGGISIDYMFDQIIKKLPGYYKFMRKIDLLRENVFKDDKDQAFSSPNNLPDLTKLQKYLDSKTPYERSQILSNYYKQMKLNMRFGIPPLKLSTLRSLEKNSEKVATKIYQFEMLFFITSNQSIIVDWVKNSFIMSLYGLASGRGKIIFDGKNIKKKEFGRKALKKYNLLNPMYLKIGS